MMIYDNKNKGFYAKNLCNVSILVLFRNRLNNEICMARD